jgi:hypothetical protein
MIRWWCHLCGATVATREQGTPCCPAGHGPMAPYPNQTGWGA